MLYTKDFSMCHYVGFSQIGSQLYSLLKGNLSKYGMYEILHMGLDVNYQLHACEKLMKNV